MYTYQLNILSIVFVWFFHNLLIPSSTTVKDSKKVVSLEDYKEYSKLIKIKETSALKSHEENTEYTSNSDRYFVVEDNEYKLLWHEDFKKKFSHNYASLACVEIYKKENKDLNKAAIYINKALEIDNTNSRAYYAQAYVYIDLKRYDEALKASENNLKNLDKKDKNYKKNISDTYNLNIIKDL